MEFSPEPPDYSGVLYAVPAQEEAEARQLLRNRYFIWRQGKEWCSQAPDLPEEVSGGFCHSESQEILEKSLEVLLPPNSDLTISCGAL